MSALAEAKRSFYRTEQVAQAYDRQRFGGVSGAYVNERELAAVAALLPAHVGVIADIGAGTGRLLPLLQARADRVLALDASMAMLRQAHEKTPAQSQTAPARHEHRGPFEPGPTGSGPQARARAGGRAAPQGLSPRSGTMPALIQADGFSLPITTSALDAATCMRVLFHFDDPGSLLRELRRVVKPGGVLVADTAAWSPRGLLPLGRGRWGEHVVTMSRARFRALARASGWQVQEDRAGFLISPYMYRRLPLRWAQALEGLEPHLPRPLLCRVFWRLTPA